MSDSTSVLHPTSAAAHAAARVAHDRASSVLRDRDPAAARWHSSKAAEYEARLSPLAG